MRLARSKTYRRIVPQWEDPDEVRETPVMKWLTVPRRNGRPISVRTAHSSQGEDCEMWLSWVDRLECQRLGRRMA